MFFWYSSTQVDGNCRRISNVWKFLTPGRLSAPQSRINRVPLLHLHLFQFLDIDVSHNFSLVQMYVKVKYAVLKKY